MKGGDAKMPTMKFLDFFAGIQSEDFMKDSPNAEWNA